MSTMTYLGTFTGSRGDGPRIFFSGMGRKTYAIEKWDDEYGDKYEVRVEAGPEDAHVVSSLLPNGLHAPAIDIDLPVHVIESSTPGHSHLYIEKAMTWRQYRRILRALVAAGVVEKGYYRASKARGATHPRLPWVTKREEVRHEAEGREHGGPGHRQQRADRQGLRVWRVG